MIEHEREINDAISQDQPKIVPRNYGRYADVVDRMGVEWFERVMEDWEGDHPLDRQGKRQ